MSGLFWLDWAVLAVSLFNTVLLLWLGLTVLLTAEPRRPGIWLAGAGLLLGAGFFIAHTAILGRGVQDASPTLDIWWHLGWIPIILLPCTWYIGMLWYVGFWEDPRSALHRRHRPGLLLVVPVMVVLALLIVFFNPLPSLTQLLRFDLHATPEIAGIPVMLMVFPGYTLLCIVLALDALRHPGPSGRVMGQLARRRARPWLVAASATLLLVALLVTWVIFWVVLGLEGQLGRVYSTRLSLLMAFDLAIAALLALTVMLIGRAVVAYEIFTGKTLPRHGFLRQWHRAVALAAGYSILVGWNITIHLRPLYAFLLTTVLIALFYALVSWASYSERERTIDQLRPFMTSQRLVERLVQPAAVAGAAGPSEPEPPDVDVAVPFRALCHDVLGARHGYLAALGPLAPLAGAPLVYPEGLSVQPALAEIGAQLQSPQTICVPLDPARHGGAVWAVPLWSERGLVGVLLLGPKVDGGLYTQEEIEIARASGERLVDAQAGATMARRLMALQRERLAESQLLDRRARRVLHDDVLPRLHTALLDLEGSAPPDALALLGDAHRQIADLLHAMPPPTAREVARLGLLGALRQAVDEELTGAFDGIRWEVTPDADSTVQAIPPLTGEVLFYAAREAIRNAARYGRDGDPARPLHLRVAVDCRRGLEIIVEDDGVGLAAGARSAGGSGQGLALHSTLLAVVGGALATESEPGRYTRVILSLPQGAW